MFKLQRLEADLGINPILVNETINAQRYQTLLLETLLNQLDELTNDYFQQDSTTAHTPRTTIIETLTNIFKLYFL